MGNMNASHSKRLFNELKHNRLTYGPSLGNNKVWFKVPKNYKFASYAGCKIVGEHKYISVKSVRWYTNLKHGVPKPKLNLTEKYCPVNILCTIITTLSK